MTVTQRDAAIITLKDSCQAMLEADPPTLAAAYRHHFEDSKTTAKIITSGDPDVLRGELISELKENAYRLGIEWTLIAGERT